MNELEDLKILSIFAKNKTLKSYAVEAYGLRFRWNTHRITVYDYVENDIYNITVDQLNKLIEEMQK